MSHTNAQTNTHLRPAQAHRPLRANEPQPKEHRGEQHAREHDAQRGVRGPIARRRALGEPDALEGGLDGRRGGGARLRPLAVAADDGALEAVDELGERDVLAVLEDVDRLEVLVRPVPKLEAKEVARVRGRAPAELDCDGGAEVRCAREGDTFREKG